MAYSRQVYKREAEAAEKDEKDEKLPEPTPSYQTKIFGHHPHHHTNATCK